MSDAVQTGGWWFHAGPPMMRASWSFQGAAVDVLNLDVPPDLDWLYEMVGPNCRLPRLSTFAVGTIINRAVAAMAPDHSYVNVGTWHGFSLLAGMFGNPDRNCVGIDDFSLFGGPREAFNEWFGRLGSPNHRFHEMDYREYFDRVHDGPIGVYFYDGPHRYEDQLLGLEAAEPFFADDCIVIVDDTNWIPPYSATRDFVGRSRRNYTVLLDEETADTMHPNLWNGLLIMRVSTDASAISWRDEKPHQEPKDFAPVPFDDSRAVSVVIRNSRSTPERLETAIEEARCQKWPALDVVVAEGSTAVAAALEDTRGDYVAFADAETKLHPSAVRIGLAFPDEISFWRDPTETSLRELERILELIDETSSVVPAGESLTLANGGLPLPRIVTGHAITPFLEGALRNPAGPPIEDMALEQLDQLRDSGERFLGIGWRSFEWLEQFPRFRDEVDAHARRVFESDNVVVFDLRR